MMAKHTSAQVNVIGLIGERGREVREFVENELGPEVMAHSVVVVSTSDDSALLRIRAAMTATAISEYFKDCGADVLDKILLNKPNMCCLSFSLASCRAC